jgi:ribosomal protein S18 acetylase RimI-like enzyme
MSLTDRLEDARRGALGVNTTVRHNTPHTSPRKPPKRPHVDNPRLQFIKATEAHASQIMAWFPDEHSCRVWGGPAFRFPFTLETFVADSKLAEAPSYVLIRDPAELCAFGQFYLRAGRCHLARLAVAPAERGRGIGTELIRMLVQEGTRSLGVTESSLFVHITNTSALALYQRLGFACAAYPEPDQMLPNSHYMIGR